EYTFRKLGGSGRRACAPRRTRDGDHLGIRNGPAAERFLATSALKTATQTQLGVSNRSAHRKIVEISPSASYTHRLESKQRRQRAAIWERPGHYPPFTQD